MAIVHHLSTGYSSPQYHLVFDDLFETVFSTGNDALLEDICHCLFDSDHDSYFYDNELISDDLLVYHLFHLDEVGLSEPDHYACRHNLEECCCLVEDCE